MDGSLVLESEPSKGTRAILSIPVIKCVKPDQAASSHEVLSASFNKLSVEEDTFNQPPNPRHSLSIQIEPIQSFIKSRSEVNVLVVEDKYTAPQPFLILPD